MKRVVNILAIIYIMVLYYFVSSDVKLIFTMNFGLYVLLYSLFNNSSIDNKMDRIIRLLILLMPISIISYFIGNLIGIKSLDITDLLCSIFVFINVIVCNNKKVSNVYYFILFLLNIMFVLIFRNSYSVFYLYFTSFGLFIVIFIINFKRVWRKFDIKRVMTIENREGVFINIIKSSYLYISLIILYYMLCNRYITSNADIILSDTFLFGILFIYLLYKIIDKYLNIDYDIKDYNNIFNRVLSLLFNVCILLMIISYPICKVLFNSDYNFVFNLIIILFFYVIYSVIINISINNISDRRLNISLLFGLLVKIVFEIPLINAVYRMGYDLVLGSILSSSLGMITTICLCSIFIVKKYKINILSNFNNILNIIYVNIIYLLILILFTLVVKVDSDKYFVNILVILFYVFINIMFNIIKKIMNKRSAK